MHRINNARSFTLIFLSLLVPFILCGQTKTEIVDSGLYYFGEATAEQEQEARDRSMKNLTEQISVTISSFNEREIVEKSTSIADAFRNITKTYSQATLRNVRYVKRQTGNGIEVFSYIAKTEVEKVFEERKQLIRNIFDKAQQSHEDNNLIDALKYYYFTIILMNSVPERTIMHGPLNLTLEVPSRINQIVTGVKFTISADRKLNEKEREIEMRVEAGGKPVRQADFSFWDGNSQVNVTAVDGVGVFRLYGASASFDKLNIEVKYKYYESREEITEVAELWDLVIKPAFKNTREAMLRSISQNDTTISAAPKRLPILNVGNREKAAPTAKIEAATKNFLTIVKNGSVTSINETYGKDKFFVEKLIGMMKFNKIQITEGLNNAEIHKTLTGWELRPIRVLCNYPTLNRQSSEYLILDFTNDGTLEDVNFGTLESLYAQFVEQGAYGNDWGNRQVIVKFMERYRTAFMTRNIEMLDSLFADEAVIIVGRELKRGIQPDGIQYTKLNPSQPELSYTQYTKKEYLKNQRKVFQSQKDIVIGFSTFKIFRKNEADGSYGISMKQNYASTSYADEGHLFLFVDFQQVLPQIYVRSWQPREWNEDAMIRLSNFRVNK